ncbi:MAG: RIO1 family regulatory kinase/ATPase [Nanoarchaeota archaeon]
MEKIIQTGAEAQIILKNNNILKRRVKKSYRIKELDEKIRKLRTRSETKLLEKASKIICVPKVIESSEEKKEIILEFIDGKKLSDNLNNFPLKKQKEICIEIGKNIAKLHDEEIIHGDLTTSNIIYSDNSKKYFNKASAVGVGEQFRERNLLNQKRAGLRVGWGSISKSKKISRFQIFFIDFGLGFISNRLEDKAVDLHLLKEALEAKHFQNWEILFEEVLKGHKISRNFQKVLKQFRKVESRGRYKEKY